MPEAGSPTAFWRVWVPRPGVRPNCSRLSSTQMILIIKRDRETQLEEGERAWVAGRRGGLWLRSRAEEGTSGDREEKERWGERLGGGQAAGPRGQVKASAKVSSLRPRGGAPRALFLGSLVV